MARRVAVKWTDELIETLLSLIERDPGYHYGLFGSGDRTYAKNTVTKQICLHVLGHDLNWTTKLHNEGYIVYRDNAWAATPAWLSTSDDTVKDRLKGFDEQLKKIAEKHSLNIETCLDELPPQYARKKPFLFRYYNIKKKPVIYAPLPLKPDVHTAIGVLEKDSGRSRRRQRPRPKRARRSREGGTVGDQTNRDDNADEEGNGQDGWDEGVGQVEEPQIKGGTRAVSGLPPVSRPRTLVEVEIPIRNLGRPKTATSEATSHGSTSTATMMTFNMPGAISVNAEAGPSRTTTPSSAEYTASNKRHLDHLESSPLPQSPAKRQRTFLRSSSSARSQSLFSSPIAGPSSAASSYSTPLLRPSSTSSASVILSSSYTYTSASGNDSDLDELCSNPPDEDPMEDAGTAILPPSRPSRWATINDIPSPRASNSSLTDVSAIFDDVDDEVDMLDDYDTIREDKEEDAETQHPPSDSVEAVDVDMGHAMGEQNPIQQPFDMLNVLVSPSPELLPSQFLQNKLSDARHHLAAVLSFRLQEAIEKQSIQPEDASRLESFRILLGHHLHVSSKKRIQRTFALTIRLSFEGLTDCVDLRKLSVHLGQIARYFRVEVVDSLSALMQGPTGPHIVRLAVSFSEPLLSVTSTLVNTVKDREVFRLSPYLFLHFVDHYHESLQARISRPSIGDSIAIAPEPAADTQSVEKARSGDMDVTMLNTVDWLRYHLTSSTEDNKRCLLDKLRLRILIAHGRQLYRHMPKLPVRLTDSIDLHWQDESEMKKDALAVLKEMGCHINFSVKALCRAEGAALRYQVNEMYSDRTEARTKKSVAYRRISLLELLLKLADLCEAGSQKGEDGGAGEPAEASSSRPSDVDNAVSNQRVSADVKPRPSSTAHLEQVMVAADIEHDPEFNQLHSRPAAPSLQQAESLDEMSKGKLIRHLIGEKPPAALQDIDAPQLAMGDALGMTHINQTIQSCVQKGQLSVSKACQITEIQCLLFQLKRAKKAMSSDQAKGVLGNARLYFDDPEGKYRRCHAWIIKLYDMIKDLGGTICKDKIDLHSGHADLRLFISVRSPLHPQAIRSNTPEAPETAKKSYKELSVLTFLRLLTHLIGSKRATKPDGRAVDWALAMLRSARQEDCPGPRPYSLLPNEWLAVEEGAPYAWHNARIRSYVSGYEIMAEKVRPAVEGKLCIWLDMEALSPIERRSKILANALRITGNAGVIVAPTYAHLLSQPPHVERIIIDKIVDDPLPPPPADPNTNESHRASLLAFLSRMDDICTANTFDLYVLDAYKRPRRRRTHGVGM